MLPFIFGVLLFGILLVALSAQKTYSYVPVKELKRQARAGDGLAQVLYSAVGYGFSLRALLWFVIGVSAAGSFMLLQMALPGWLTFIVLVFMLWLGFMWLPTSQLSSLSARVVAFVTPAITKALQYLHPALDRLAVVVQKYRPVSIHTGLYEREDLVQLLQNQAQQSDSRIEAEDLILAERALLFGDVLVRETMTPRRVVKAVHATDAVGAVLMDELHESGHSRFPVYDDTEKVVGVLYLKDVVAGKLAGKVQERLRPEVFYVHEDHDLRQVLHAFLATKHHLFIVVNEFEEYVGIITIEDVLEMVVGQPIVDEFDRYDDLRAVAAQQAGQEHQDHTEAVVELKP